MAVFLNVFTANASLSEQDLMKNLIQGVRKMRMNNEHFQASRIVNLKTTLLKTAKK